MKNLIVVVIVGLLVWIGFDSYERRRSTRVEQPSTPAPAHRAFVDASAPSAQPTFACDGRIHCSQMRSCEEATYFLQHCPGTKMDGDRDGLPCEQQWCR